MIRQFIREFIKYPPPKITSAGILIVRNSEDGWRVLLLKKFDGSFDIPKGHLKPREKSLEGAIRETREETRITDLDFRWGTESMITNTLEVFLAATNQDPQILPNPETRQYEHDGFHWVSLEKSLDLLKPYLLSVIIWAKGKIS